MTLYRTAALTRSFLAAHAAPLPAHVTREVVKATLDSLTREGGRLDAMALDASYSTFTLCEPEGRTLCTLQRPRMIGDATGLYQLALCDGRQIAAFPRCPSVKKVYEAVYSYLAAPLPADCDPAAELESYRASFDDSFGRAFEDFATFRASAMTRAARWAYRIAAAEAAIAATPAPELAPVAAEGNCLCLLCGGQFDMGAHDVQICPACYPAERAAAVARLEAETSDGRKTLDQLEAEDSAAKAATRAARKTLDQLEAEAAEAPPVVDLTPTWEGVARIIELGLTNGNATGRQIAREELARMAAIADSAVAAAKDTARAEALEMARACLAAYPEIARGTGRESGPARRARDLRDALAALVATL